MRNRLGFLHATAPRRILARALSSHLRQMVRDAHRPEGGPLAVAQLRAIPRLQPRALGEAPDAFLAARRRDYATGGALHGPVVPSWSLPRDYDTAAALRSLATASDTRTAPDGACRWEQKLMLALLRPLYLLLVA